MSAAAVHEEGLLARSDPSFTALADDSKRQELPPGVWREVLLHLRPEERFVASMVCKAWRGHALSLLIPDLEVSLNSGASATGFSRWLHAHSHKLHSLTITEYYFSHHGRAPVPGTAIRSRLGQIARVQLWQGLHSWGKPLQELHTLKIKLDDISTADAVAIGLCVMPALTHLTLESNASAIGVTGAAGLVPLTSLKELVLPSQALGDQGLQYIGNALKNLHTLNVYNDGHVTDDGMAALARLTALMSLDLQGNVSITQAAMPTLASAAPRLRCLNMSWLAMVNDWGLGQLTPMVDMQDLNLRATGVRLESQPAVLALQSFSALTRLDLTRCGVAAAGIAAIAATVPSLQELNLSENGVLRSFTELRSLQQLSRLTKLDVSSPSTAMRMPDSEHTAVCELTQLRHLALNSVMLTRRIEEWLLPSGQQSMSQLGIAGPIYSELLAAAAPLAAALTQHSSFSALSLKPQPAAASEAGPTAAAQDASNSGGGAGSSPWASLLLALPKLINLTTLEFAGNGGSYFLTSRPSSAEDLEKGLNKLRTYEPALLLLRFAAAANTGLHIVYFTNADHHHHAPHVGSVREHTGELSGRWNDALPAVAAAMLLAVGECQEAAQQVSGTSMAAAAAGGGDGNGAVSVAEGPTWEGPLEQQLGSMQVAAEQGGSSSSSSRGAAKCDRVFSAASRQRLQALIGKLQAAQQQQQQQQSGGAKQATECVVAPRPCLSQVEANEALQLLLPGLQSLHFPW